MKTKKGPLETLEDLVLAAFLMGENGLDLKHVLKAIQKYGEKTVQKVIEKLGVDPAIIQEMNLSSATDSVTATNGFGKQPGVSRLNINGEKSPSVSDKPQSVDSRHQSHWVKQPD